MGLFLLALCISYPPTILLRTMFKIILSLLIVYCCAGHPGGQRKRDVTEENDIDSALLGELLNLELETRGVTCHLIEGGKEYKVNSVIQVGLNRLCQCRTSGQFKCSNVAE